MLHSTYTLILSEHILVRLPCDWLTANGPVFCSVYVPMHYAALLIIITLSTHSTRVVPIVHYSSPKVVKRKSRDLLCCSKSRLKRLQKPHHLDYFFQSNFSRLQPLEDQLLFILTVCGSATVKVEEEAASSSLPSFEKSRREDVGLALLSSLKVDDEPRPRPRKSTVNGTNSRDEWRKSPIKHQISPNDVDEKKKKKYGAPFFLFASLLLSSKEAAGEYIVVLFKSFLALLNSPR